MLLALKVTPPTAGGMSAAELLAILSVVVTVFGLLLTAIGVLLLKLLAGMDKRVTDVKNDLRAEINELRGELGKVWAALDEMRKQWWNWRPGPPPPLPSHGGTPGDGPGAMMAGMTPPRTAGKRGLVRESHAPELRLSLFRTIEPTPPATGDVTGGLTEWTMLGNDTYGDCGPAATMHGRMAKALVSVADGVATYEPGFVVPTTTYTEKLYFAYGKAQGEPGPDPDEGVTNATWLKYLFDQGVIEWFGELDPKNLAEVRQAMLDCRGVLVAVSLTDDAETRFANREPWTVANGETPDPQEGHDILLVRYTPTGDTFVTWAQLQEATVAWDSDCILDVWCFGTREDAERAGYTADALIAAIRSWGASVSTK